MPETYYQKRIYPLQDKVLKKIEAASLDFYLTGGTALGRCYIKHRYSDDLDFFVNDHKEFKKQCNQAVDLLKRFWNCNIATASASFVRIFIEEDGVSLKIDFINDVPVHYGAIEPFPVFHRVDSWRNILSNKLCALSRLEAKDI
ncbi:MAG: nucleotidyl transferase AbiEii/AbiGii toxin family protein, partial [Deltaproteobacteria bacterium]|nr:nucleotidyl transferase AbiEii/AbiGii toxin family protein [Deltaproteobacteria bacterium]